MKGSQYMSFLEGAYLIFMFRWFKTTMNFDQWRPGGHMDVDDRSALYHSAGNEYESKICPFGQWAIILLAIVLIARHYTRVPGWIVLAALCASGLLSLLNLNAFVYLLPIWAVEAWRSTSAPL